MADICTIVRGHSVTDHSERTDEVSKDILSHNCDCPQAADLDLFFSFALEISHLHRVVETDVFPYPCRFVVLGFDSSAVCHLCLEVALGCYSSLEATVLAPILVLYHIPSLDPVRHVDDQICRLWACCTGCLRLPEVFQDDLDAFKYSLGALLRLIFRSWNVPYSPASRFACGLLKRFRRPLVFDFVIPLTPAKPQAPVT